MLIGTIPNGKTLLLVVLALAVALLASCGGDDDRMTALVLPVTYVPEDVASPTAAQTSAPLPTPPGDG